MTTDVALSQSLRNNLLSLQNTSDLIDDVTKRLATGRKVNDALDDPLNFFTSQSLTNRAGDLSRLLDGIGQSISTIENSLNGVESIQSLVQQAEAIVNSARDALNDGQREAKLTGGDDLSRIDALTDLSGIDSGDAIGISITDPADGDLLEIFDTQGNSTGTLAEVTITEGMTVEQFISEINALRDAGDDEIVEASLDESGNLVIRSLNGGNLRVEFLDDFTGGAGTTSGAQQLSTDLGFSNVEDLIELDTDGTTRIAITASASSSLQSQQFLDSNNNPVSRSDTLLSILDEDGNNVFAGGTNDQIAISVNGENLITVIDDISTATLQDFIDSINNDTNLSEFISASFDEDTGRLSIEAGDPTLESVQIGAVDDTSSATNISFDFGFGALGSLTPADGSTTTESISFSSAAGNLLELEQDYNSIREQIDFLVNDSVFRGTNLLNGDSLVTVFNEDRTSLLTTTGQILTSSGLGLIEADFGRLTTVEDSAARVRSAQATLRSFGSSITNDLAVIEARERFTERTINTLETASDKLTLADQNEEGTRLLALQTRSQLALQSLSLAAQGQAGVLQLF